MTAAELKKWCVDKSAAESLGVVKELREAMVVALEAASNLKVSFLNHEGLSIDLIQDAKVRLLIAELKEKP